MVRPDRHVAVRPMPMTMALINLCYCCRSHRRSVERQQRRRRRLPTIEWRPLLEQNERHWRPYPKRATPYTDCADTVETVSVSPWHSARIVRLFVFAALGCVAPVVYDECAPVANGPDPVAFGRPSVS